jgi:lycopene beta-cyclase
MDFFGPGGRAIPLDLRPYAYKMLRSRDFYAHADRVIAQAPHVDRWQARIESYTQAANGDVLLHLQPKDTAGNPPTGNLPGGNPPTNPLPTTVQAPLVLASTPLEGWEKEARQGLWLEQHFAGYFLRTQKDLPRHDRGTLMDFRVEQVGGYPCFVYVLPLEPRYALVEYTVFSPDAWTLESYRPHLEAYIHQNMGLKPGAYRVEEVEQGRIPMSTWDFGAAWRRRHPELTGLVPVGVMGGLARPSTGYTFRNIQHHNQAILQSLAKALLPTGALAPVASWRDRLSYRPAQRFGWYDQALLRVLVEQRYPGARLFERLFAGNPTPDMLAFLDGESRLVAEIGIMNSTPRRIMAAAMLGL